MKLWLITAKIKNLPNSPWAVPYDCAYEFVIRANTGKEARNLASEKHGDEGKNAWLNEKHSSCQELLPEGKPGVIVTDFWNG